MKKSILIWENNNSNKIYYTTNDSNIINVWNYWLNNGYKPIINKYDKEKNQGVMVFENPLTEIPGIIGHPFLYDQKNLLTLKLPTTVKRLNRGCFYGCSNLYQCNVEDLVLEELGHGCFEETSIQNLDFRKSVFTDLRQGGQLRICNLKYDSVTEYVLFSPDITHVSSEMFTTFLTSDGAYNTTRIKTLMIPTISSNMVMVENTILENLIINKFDGLGDLHYFNTDCIIWVPDEFYDGYVEKYTNYIPDAYLNKDNCEDIISRLKKYSDGVPKFK